MKKINLVITVIFTLIWAGNSFGQAHPEVGRTVGIKATKVKTTKIKSKKPSGFSEVSGLTQETQYRRKHSRRKSAQYNPKEIGIDKIKARKPTSFTSAEGRSMSFELRRKPRKGKRVHKP